MRFKRGAWDGAQPRGHVLGVLRTHGVEVLALDGDWFELVDSDGDPLVIEISNPVVSEMVTYLYRRFGELHGIKITEFVKRRPN